MLVPVLDTNLIQDQKKAKSLEMMKKCQIPHYERQLKRLAPTNLLLPDLRPNNCARDCTSR